MGRGLRVAEFEEHVTRYVAQLVDEIRLESDRGRTMSLSQIEKIEQRRQRCFSERSLRVLYLHFDIYQSQSTVGQMV